ncbi:MULTISPECIES: SDR family NAD(P)-dependent oxidoreductase [Gammaproteobacteria]|uniref:SDR family NAD(P)-dependent oxidoreductase n=1 Tax=Gammaproteobacteria TaxID=1236 RepID=UPI000DCF94EE|nr:MULTISPECIES: SDR family NAD(P)-dependent oxidoreductase [Gammaproteobacteria]RTE87580.1 SDR family NAD(P)-dependent oxidoreductase [Aliidiomarina sp. B3213]TCZ92636.1 SDR family NAD(P)-dependent oxidoreductase [Lysobacter sp. N42]
MDNSSLPVAVITGASRRLGLLMVSSFLARGWRVVALTRTVSDELSNLSCDELECVHFDALDASNIETVVKRLQARYEHIDFLLHNASIYEKDAEHEDDFSDFYDSLYKIHMKTPAQLNRRLEGQLTKSIRPTANVIHITDIYVSNPNPDYALYCSTKAGLESLMISDAKRLAPKVRVNAIRPGPVKFLPEHSDSDQKKVLQETLLATEGGFEVLEQAIWSILDNEYMTAAVVKVDGGRSVAR